LCLPAAAPPPEAPPSPCLPSRRPCFRRRDSSDGGRRIGGLLRLASRRR
jgi:hypothetical protein